MTKQTPESRILTEIQNQTEISSKQNVANRRKKTENETEIRSKQDSENQHFSVKHNGSRGYFTSQNQEKSESRGYFTSVPAESENQGYFTETFKQRRGYSARDADSAKSDFRSAKDLTGEENGRGYQTLKAPVAEKRDSKIIQGCLLRNGGLTEEYRKVLIEIRPKLSKYRDANKTI